MQRATLCYLRDGERTLMLRSRAQGKHGGTYLGLENELLRGDDPTACLKQAFRRTTGLTLADAHWIGEAELPGHTTPCVIDDRQRMLRVRPRRLLVYTATGHGVPSSSTEGEYVWVPTRELSALRLRAEDHYILLGIERAEAERKHFHARMSYGRDGTLSGFDVKLW